VTAEAIAGKIEERRAAESLAGLDPAQQQEAIEASEADILRQADRGYLSQMMRTFARGYQIGRHVQDADDILEATEAVIRLVCDRGNLDFPDLTGKSKHKKRRAA
jgi:hypothetical protein